MNVCTDHMIAALGHGEVCLPAARMLARGMRQLATVVTSVSLSEPKGIQVSQMRDASVFVASPMVTCRAHSRIPAVSKSMTGNVQFADSVKPEMRPLPVDCQQQPATILQNANAVPAKCQRAQVALGLNIHQMDSVMYSLLHQGARLAHAQ